MARKRVEPASGNTTAIEAPATAFLVKCECPDKDSFELVAKNGGHCSRCGRGVHTHMAQRPEAFGPGFFGTAAPTMAPAAPVAREPGDDTDDIEAELAGIVAPTAVAPKEIVEPFPPAPSLMRPPSMISDIPIDFIQGSPESLTLTAGEEMYGKQGTFSSYRVGPITASTHVRPGETLERAYARLRTELSGMMVAERESKKAEFIAHFQKAF